MRRHALGIDVIIAVHHAFNGEPRLDHLAASLGQTPARTGLVVEPLNRLGDLLGGIRVDQEPVDTVRDDFFGSARLRSDDRDPGCQRLYYRERKPFGTRGTEIAVKILHDVVYTVLEPR